MRIIVSDCDSALWNNAAEQFIMTELLGGALFLYVNRRAVVVGRNQTIEAEVDVEFCRQNGVEIVRRISGGGAVYHDCGNVNYAFIGDRERGSLLDSQFTAPVVDALGSMGVRAEVGARRELLVGGVKISGTASHTARGRQLAHGTLLYDADLEMLERALQGCEQMRGRGVASVRSGVVNLSTLIGQGWSTKEFMDRLVAFFQVYYCDSFVQPFTDQEIQRLKEDFFCDTHGR